MNFRRKKWNFLDDVDGDGDLTEIVKNDSKSSTG